MPIQAQAAASSARPNTPTRVVLMAFVLDCAIMGTGQAVMRVAGGVRYGDAGMLVWLFPAEVAMTLMLFHVTRRYFSLDRAGLGPVSGRGRWLDGLGVAVPIAVAGLLLASWVAGDSSPDFAGVNTPVVLVGIPTLALVGISEELMFRGLTLHHFANVDAVASALSRWSERLISRGLARHNLAGVGSKALGVAVSAVLFSLFHAVNAIGGLPAPAVAYQMIGTLAFGALFGALALWLPSIRPLMALHFLWDYAVFIGGYFHSPR